MFSTVSIPVTRDKLWFKFETRLLRKAWGFGNFDQAKETILLIT